MLNSPLSQIRHTQKVIKTAGFFLLWLAGSAAAVAVAWTGVSIVDDELINRVTWKIPNALALVGSAHDGVRNAMTTSWITQLSMEPVLIGIGVDNAAVTHRLISGSGAFSVNRLGVLPSSPGSSCPAWPSHSTESERGEASRRQRSRDQSCDRKLRSPSCPVPPGVRARSLWCEHSRDIPRLERHSQRPQQAERSHQATLDPPGVPCP